ncbi:hypothetical protein GE09DRAFT_1077891 [Coniochaeta sp. 2T2.1]|nr:hypothetical protein GE09DRAFT_1077891 [Coniochaeta sp. 2T2.1]
MQIFLPAGCEQYLASRTPADEPPSYELFEVLFGPNYQQKIGEGDWPGQGDLVVEDAASLSGETLDEQQWMTSRTTKAYNGLRKRLRVLKGARTIQAQLISNAEEQLRPFYDSIEQRIAAITLDLTTADASINPYKRSLLYAERLELKMQKKRMEARFVQPLLHELANIDEALKDTERERRELVEAGHKLGLMRQ